MTGAGLLQVLDDGLSLIIALLGHGTPDAVKAAEAAAHSLREGIDGKTTPELVLQQLNGFRDTLAAKDAEELNKLHEKFDTGETKP